MDELEATEFLVGKLRDTKNNADFFDSSGVPFTRHPSLLPPFTPPGLAIRDLLVDNPPPSRQEA